MPHSEAPTRITLTEWVCFVNTVGRYAFHHSFRAAEEIVILCAVWVTCVGASMTARADDHVTLDLLQELVKSNKVKAVLYAITRGLACAFLLLLLPAAFQMVKIYAPMKGERIDMGTIPTWSAPSPWFWVTCASPRARSSPCGTAPRKKANMKKSMNMKKKRSKKGRWMRKC